MRKLPNDLSSATTVGLDLVKHVFFIHAEDAQGQVVFAKEVRRRDLLSFFASLPACLVGVEACSSAHHWGRELMALGHDVRLMPPAYVKPYVKRQKNDAADAAAICEAVTRPSMRFVKVRSIDNQAVLMHHKVREMLVRQRTQIFNGLRGHLAEIGIIAAQGPVHARALANLLRNGDVSIPEAVATALLPLVIQLEHLDAEIKEADAAIATLAKTDPVAVALMSIPGIGPVTTTALVASVGDPSGFSGPRQFAAFLGLVPRQNSSGGKPRLGRISKMGNAYLRKLLAVGAHAVHYHRARHHDPLRCWAQKLIETKPFKLVAVAIANKLARIVFAVMTTGKPYRAAKA